MQPNDDQLTVLDRLRTEGQISDEEYQNLVGSPDEPPSDPPHSDPDVTTELSDESTDLPFPRPSLREDISSTHVLALAIADILIAGMAFAGLLSGWIAFLAILVSLTTLIEGWQKVTSFGALIVGAFFLVGVVSSITAGAEPEPVAAAPQNDAPAEPDAPVPGSLGIYMDKVPELWNTVDAPPTINRGLIRQNDIGEYDSFVYRFGDGAQVAGAYDPDDDAVYALLVSGPFDNPATSSLYLHVCYMVAPFSQECLDAYTENGLNGDSLEEFTDTVHEAEWVFGEHTWRLEIGQNLLAIRVYGEDAA